MPMGMPVSRIERLSSIDAYEELSVSGEYGTPSTIVFRPSFYERYNCNGDINLLFGWQYLYSVKSVSGSRYTLYVKDIMLKLNSQKYSLYKCQRGISGVYTTLSNLRCYNNGVEMLGDLRALIGTTISVVMTFGSSYATFGQYRIPLSKAYYGCGISEEEEDNNWKLILFLSLDAIVCIALIVLGIRCAMKNKKKTVPKK